MSKALVVEQRASLSLLIHWTHVPWASPPVHTHGLRLAVLSLVLWFLPSLGHGQLSGAPQLLIHLFPAISDMYLLCLRAILLAKDVAKSAI